MAKFSLYENILLGVILLNVLSISITPINLYETRIFILLILVFLLTLIVNFNYESLSKIRTFNINLFSLLGILIISLFIISSFYINLEYNFQLRAIAKLVLYPIIVSLFFLSFPKVLFKSDVLFEKFLNFWIFFTFFCTIIAFSFLLAGVNYNPKIGTSTIGFFYSSNLFSFVFTFAVPMLIYKYFTKQINLTMLVVSEIVLLACLLLTYSRAGYIGVFVTILLLTYRRSKVLFFVSAFILIVLASTFFLNFALAKTDSSVGRFQIMYAAYNMIFNNGISYTLWGYGIFNNIAVFQYEITQFGLIRDERDPHNLILLMGIQFGMLLTVTVVIFVVLLLIKAIFLNKKHLTFEFQQKINLCLAIVVGVIVQNMLEDIVIYPEHYVMPVFLIFLGYLYYSIFNFNNKSAN